MFGALEVVGLEDIVAGIAVETGVVIGGAMVTLWGMSGLRKTSGETVTGKDWLPGGSRLSMIGGCLGCLGIALTGTTIEGVDAGRDDSGISWLSTSSASDQGS